MSSRRIVGIVLSDLLCEITRQRHPSWGGSRRKEPPFGVLFSTGRESGSEEGSEEEDVPKAATLAAVNESARRYGVRPGQTVAEAHAFVARLLTPEVTHAEVEKRLGEIAEMAMALGPTVSLELPDTVWVDVTGSAHLSGGEERLALEFASKVSSLGHKTRVVVGSGPRLVQAFARWGNLSRDGIRVLEDSPAVFEGLSVKALPAPSEIITWLMRLGVRTFRDLCALPREAVGPRLGPAAGALLDLAAGKDDSPLVAYVPPPMLEEEATWEEPVTGSEPLLFVLRGLTSRLSARVEGRGEAVQALNLSILHDPSISRIEGAPLSSTLTFEFASPLHRQEELYRVLSSRLSRSELRSPSIGLRLETKAITRALALQLSLSRHASGLGGDAHRGPELLPVVLSELTTDLGKDKVGVLERVSSHRLEKKSRLASISPARLRSRQPNLFELGEMEAEGPTRLLGRPIPFEAPLRQGSVVSIDHRLYTVEKVAFDRRLDAVEWWTKEPVSRDYVRVWLSGARGGLEALVYKDRITGTRWLQGIWD